MKFKGYMANFMIGFMGLFPRSETEDFLMKVVEAFFLGVTLGHNMVSLSSVPNSNSANAASIPLKSRSNFCRDRKASHRCLN